MGDIYLLESPSGKKYVGQAVQYLPSGKKWGYTSRWKAHISEAKRELNYCARLDKAIRKYGSENFTITLLCQCDEHEMNEKEGYYIKLHNSLSPNGYNLTTGGGKNCRQSEETRLKKSESLKGKNVGKVHDKRPRKRVEDNELPKYIRSVKGGYRINNHPIGIGFTSRSKKLSMDVKLQQCISFLENLNAKLTDRIKE